MSKKTTGQRMANFWNTVKPRYSHFGETEIEYNALMSRFEKICKRLILSGKTVIDYGCGGGILGEYLLKKRSIAKYIGYDLSERSLSKMQERLKEFSEKVIPVLVVHHDIDFSTIKPDLIFCIACLYHFPEKEYLDRYLSRFNESDAENVVIEIRDSGEGTCFQLNTYSDFNSVTNACRTNAEYVSEKMSNYELVDASEISTNKLQILHFKKIEYKINNFDGLSENKITENQIIEKPKKKKKKEIIE